MSLFQELKRRNVIRVCLAYIVTAWQPLPETCEGVEEAPLEI